MTQKYVNFTTTIYIPIDIYIYNTCLFEMDDGLPNDRRND